MGHLFSRGELSPAGLSFCPCLDFSYGSSTAINPHPIREQQQYKNAELAIHLDLGKQNRLGELRSGD